LERALEKALERVLKTTVLKGLINKSGLDADSMEKRLQAIESLKSPDDGEQLSLQQLLLNDPEIKVRDAALQKITSLPLLAASIDKSDSRKQDQCDAIAKRLTQLLAAEPDLDAVTTLIKDGSTRIRTLVACSCSDDAMRAKAIEVVDDEDALIVIACDAKIHQTRMTAAEKLQSLDAQQKCLSRIKNKDKVVARFLQTSVNENNAAAEKESMRLASIKQLISAMSNLSESTWSPQYVGQFTALEQRWNILDPKPDATATASYSAAREIAQVKVKQFKIQRDKLESLRQISERCEEALEKLTSAKLASLKTCTDEVNNIFSTLQQEWKVASDNLDVENPFAGDFTSAIQTLKTLLPLSQSLVEVSVHELANRKTPDKNKAVNDDDANGSTESKDITKAEISTDKNNEFSEEKNPAPEQTKSPSSASKRVPVRTDQRLKIEKALSDETFTAEMACMSQLRSQLGQLDEKLEKDRQQQVQIADGVRRQLNALASAITSGKWSAAEGMSQRVERKLQQLEGKQLQPLRARFEKQRKKLDELADWQDFASLPKLQNIVQEMRALPAQNMKPRQLADEIKTLQNNWKSLGGSRAANQLWDDFKNASDTAYEPCKVYFDGLKKQREARVRNRENVCTRLRELLQTESSNTDSLDLREIERELAHAQREWHNNRPTGRKPQKKLEDQFNELCASLTALLAPRYAVGIAERQELIEKAKKLGENESNQHVINQAKSLQAAWKLCGATARKDDQVLWKEFNTACSEIFNKHRARQREQYKASMGHVDRARDIIKTIRQLSRNASEREESQCTELQDEFRQLAEFPEKIKKPLLKDFRGACDAFNRARASQGRKQQAMEMTSMRDMARLCELLERDEIQWTETKKDSVEKEAESNQQADATANDAAGDADSDAASDVVTDTADDMSNAGSVVNNEPLVLDDPVDQWTEYASHVPKPWLKRIAKRRDQAIALHQQGESPFSDDHDQARKLHCIKLEIIRDVDSPAEDKTMRMQYQLQQLQSGRDSKLLLDDAETMKQYEIDWLCLPPASMAIAATLEKRFYEALSSGKNKSDHGR